MKHLKTIIIIVGILVCIIFLSFKLYYHHDEPIYDGDICIQSLVDTVEVFSDDYGVPYIFAENNEDLFFTAGYICARERLFQLSLGVAILHGEIESLLGDKYAEHDKYINTIDNPLNVVNDLMDINDRNINLLESYCAGINTYIDETSGSLPVSFKITNSKPKKWAAKDAVNILLLMTNNIYKNDSETLILSEINQYYGGSRYNELKDIEDTGALHKRELSINDIRIEYEIYNLVGAVGSLIGSDALVIPNPNTLSKKPILIFQDIWGYKQPAKWFEIGLYGGNFNVSGSVIPGFPLPIVGRLKNSAFAFPGTLSKKDANKIFDILNDSLMIQKLQNTNISVAFADTTGYYINGSPRSQAFKYLEEKTKGIQNIQVNDLIRIFSENKNIQKAETIKGIILNYINNVSTDSPISKLLDWDGDESSGSTTALLVNTIYKNLIEGIFKDEISLIGNDIYKIFLDNTDFAEKSLSKVLENSESSWWDDINTINYKENKSDIINTAIEQSLTELKSKYGNLNWKWGEVNKPINKHVLGDEEIHNFIDRFNVGPFNRRGSNDGINIDEFSYDKNLTPVSGISLRKIYDLASINQGYSILPTGQSGLPNSPHYSDQQEYFNKQKFRKIDINKNEIRNNSKYHKLTLYPSK